MNDLFDEYKKKLDAMFPARGSMGTPEKVDRIKEYIQAHLPNTKVLVIDHDTEPACMEGFTYIFPATTIRFHPGKPDGTDGPRIILGAPELVFMIDAEGVVSCPSEFSQDFVNALNRKGDSL